MIQFPTSNYDTGSGDISNYGLFGSHLLNSLFNSMKQHDESELRRQSLEDAKEILKQRKLETDGKRLDSETAKAKLADPDFIQSGIRGYKAQNELQELAAKLSRETKDGQIARTNVENKNAELSGGLLQRLLQLKQQAVQAAGQGGGMPMQPGGGIPPGMQGALGGGIGFPMRPGGMGQPQPMNANNSPMFQKGSPLRNGGIQQGSPEYEAVMAANVDDPSLRAKLILGDQKADSAEYIANMRAQHAAEVARLRMSGKDENDNIDKALVRFWKQKLAAGEITPEDYVNEISNAFNRKTEGTPQSGVTARVDASGKVNIDNKPQKEKYVPNKKQPDPLGIR